MVDESKKQRRSSAIIMPDWDVNLMGTNGGGASLSRQQENQARVVSVAAGAAPSQQQQQQQQRRQSPIVEENEETAAAAVASTAPIPASTMTRKQKETFLLFTRVLLKYLEQKDARTFAQAKMVIKDCAQRNKRHEPGYESVTSVMKLRLKQVVSDAHWARARAYLDHFLQNKRRQQQQRRRMQVQQVIGQQQQHGGQPQAGQFDPPRPRLVRFVEDEDE